MSWIRSECGLPRHPKTLLLKTLLGIEMDAVVGRLHFLWWWCLEYAIDGDLSKKEVKVIESACQIPFKLLIRAGFVDSRPYRRIHDWWENQGAYLRSRYHKDAEKWKRIELLYEREKDISSPMSNHGHGISPVRRTDVQTYGRTDVQTDVRTLHQEARELRGASPPLALNTGKPQNQFEVDHFLTWLDAAEKVQTKLREAGFLSGKK